MNGKAHALAGAATAAPFLLALDATPAGILGGACLMVLAAAAGIAPDLDQAQNSMAIRKLGPVGRPLSRGIRALSHAARTSAWRWGGTVDDRYWWSRRRDPDHRGLTHTLVAAVVTGVVVGVLVGMVAGWGAGWPAGVVVFAGWTSHLVLDSCTVQGVPLLWPLKITHRVGNSRQEQRWWMTSWGWLESCTAADWWVAWPWTVGWVGCSLYAM